MERSETLGIVAPTMMRLKDAKIGFLGNCFRVFQTLFFVDVGFPGVALSLNPRLRALVLRPRRSTFQVEYHRNCRGIIKHRLTRTWHG